MSDNLKDLDQTDAEALYEETSDEDLELAATGGQPMFDTGNGKPTTTPQCCSYGRC
jgi:hypothetical protein